MNCIQCCMVSSSEIPKLSIVIYFIILVHKIKLCCFHSEINKFAAVVEETDEKTACPLSCGCITKSRLKWEWENKKTLTRARKHRLIE